MSDSQDNILNTSFISEKFSSLLNLDKMRQHSVEVLGYLVLLIIIFFFTIMLHYLSQAENFLESKFFTNTYLVLIPIFMMLSAIIFINKTIGKLQSFSGLIGIIIACIIIIAMNKKLNLFTTQYFSYANFIFQILTLLIVLFGLTLFYRILRERIRRLKGWIGFIANFILYIPCLLNDIFDFIKKEYNLTTSVTFVLLVIESLLIIVFVYLPKYLQDMSIGFGKVLLSDAVHLNKNQILANADDLPLNDEANKENVKYYSDNLYNQNYSLMMWVYINTNTPSEVPKHILSYGNETSGYKPKVEYIGTNEKDDTDKLKVTFFAKDKFMHINVPKQKWNFLAFNYNGSNIDLYVNGELTRTLEMEDRRFIQPVDQDEINAEVDKRAADLTALGLSVDDSAKEKIKEEIEEEINTDNIKAYSSQDKITIGDNIDSAIQISRSTFNAAICNIIYSKNVLSKENIARYYNLLINKNPPVNNIL